MAINLLTNFLTLLQKVCSIRKLFKKTKKKLQTFNHDFFHLQIQFYHVQGYIIFDLNMNNLFNRVVFLFLLPNDFNEILLLHFINTTIIKTIYAVSEL